MSHRIENKITTSLVNLLINSTDHNDSSINIMITGGRGATQLYRQWHDSCVFKSVRKPVNLFLTDERCVESSNPESNQYIINQLFSADEISNNVSFHGIFGKAKDLESEACRYEKLLPDTIDFMLLSMGEDGHICSLFPGSPLLFENNRKVKPVFGPKSPYCRLTITPKVIKSAKKIFVLAIGEDKKRKYEEALQNPGEISSIPARLVLDGTWIFDFN